MPGYRVHAALTVLCLYALTPSVPGAVFLDTADGDAVVNYGKTNQDGNKKTDPRTDLLRVMVTPSHRRVQLGHCKTLLCKVFGEAESIVWFGPAGEKISETHENIRLSSPADVSSNTLTICAAGMEDAGVYTCVAESGGGVWQAEGHVHVLAKRVRRDPQDQGRGKRQREPKPTKKPKGPKPTKKPKGEKKKKGKKNKMETTTIITTTTTTTLPPTTTSVIEYEEFDDPEYDQYWDEVYTTETPTTVAVAPPTERPTDTPAHFPTDFKPDAEEYPEPFPESEDYWNVDEPTVKVPVVGGPGGETDDYWDATYEVPESLPFPDGKVISPTDSDWVYSASEEPTVPPYESKWDEEYEYEHEKRQEKEREKEITEQEERRKESTEQEEREREQRWREEEEERARRINRPPPRVYKEPKFCPPLGMESHRVEADQLLTSSMSHHRYGPQRARLNIQASGDEDDMNGGAWCGNPEEKAHWIELDARTLTEFTGVITQGRDDPLENDYVTSYYVAFSNDSREWTVLHDGYTDWLFFGNSDKHTPVMAQFVEPVVARYIRILPQSWNGTMCMRMEVLGCPVPDPLSVYQSQNEVTPRDDLDYTYHSYHDMEKLMKSISDECPNITKLYTLGQSSKGLQIYAMEFTGNPGVHETGEPEFRYTAGYHGNEALGRELLLMFMQYLCKEHKDGNPRVRRLVEGTRIHLVPSVNPDGHVKASERGSELGSWTLGHWTEDGHDIFQNFPDLNNIYWDAEDKGMVPKLTPNHHVPIPDGYLAENGPLAVETRALLSWMESHPFVLGANLQGGERMVTYPFDMRRLTKESEEQEKKMNPRAGRFKRQYEEEEDEEGPNPYLHIGYHQENYGYNHETHGYHQENYGYNQETHGYHQENYGYNQETHGYHQENYGYNQEGYQHENQEYHQETQGYHHEGHSEGYQEGYQEGYPEGYREGYGEAEPEEEIRMVEDQSLFRWLAISYASTHRSMTNTYRGGCHTEDPTGGMGIVNRAKWKPIPGSMNDFSYLHTNCFELSIFLGCDKFPHQSELLREWEHNREALLTLIEQVHRGIKGVVRDKDGNRIVNATVSVEGVNHDVTTGEAGDYWRLLNPGEYRVTARADGHSSSTRLCVVGFEPGATICNFELSKSNWNRIKEIMALHGNKPIRLLSTGGRSRYVSHGNSGRYSISNQIPANNGKLTKRGRLQRLRRLRRLRQQRLLAAMTTTTLPPTTTMPTTTTTTTAPTTTETTMSWYDSWMFTDIPEENVTQPETELTDSLDYIYNYNIDY